MALHKKDDALGTPATLAAWHPPARNRASRRLQWLVTAIAVAGLGALVATAIAPYRIARPTIVLLIPETKGAVENRDVDEGLARQPEHVAIRASSAFERFSPAADFVCMRPGVLAQTPAGLSAALKSVDDTRGPLIVYAVGILSVTSQGCQLSESSPMALKGQGQRVTTLLESIALTRADACILCLEVWSDPNALATNLAPGLAVVKCREEIESYLATIANRPMAVLVAPAVEYAKNNPPTLLDVLAQTTMRLSDQAGTRISTHEFLEAVDRDLDIHKTWLASKAWFERKVELRLPHVAPLAIVASPEPAVVPGKPPAAGKLVRSLSANPRSTGEALAVADQEQPEPTPLGQAPVVDTEKRFNELLELIEPTTSEATAQARLATWEAEAVVEGAEINIVSTIGSRWGKHFLLDSRLPWQLRQDLLRNRLLSLRLLNSSQFTIAQFADFIEAEKNRSSSEQLAARQFGQDWLVNSLEQSATAHHQLQTCEEYLHARAGAIDLTVRLCRELPHWDRVLNPNHDRQIGHDRICQCIERLFELRPYLVRFETDDSEELLRLTSELSVMRGRWQAEAEESLRTTSTAHVDLGKFLQSPLASERLRQLGCRDASSTAGAHVSLPSHAAIWMRVQRQKSLLQLLGLLTDEAVKTNSHQTPSTEVWDHLRELAELCNTTKSSNHEVLQVVHALSAARSAWLKQISVLLNNSAPNSHNLSALSLLATLEPSLIDLDRCTTAIEQSKQLENYRQRAEYCVTQLEYGDQRAALIWQLERQLLNRGLVGAGHQPVRDPMDGLRLSLAESSDLSIHRQQLFPVHVGNETDRSQRFSISGVFDAERINCRFVRLEVSDQPASVRFVASESEDSIAMTKSDMPGICQFSGDVAPYATHELLLEIVARDGATGQAKVDVQLECAEGKRCYQIETQLPNSGMFALRMVNRHGFSAESVDNTVESLFGNRVNPMAIELTNQLSQALPASVRILAVESLAGNIPVGVMDTAQVDAWLATQVNHVLVDNTPAALIQPRQAQLIKLPPLKVEPPSAALLANQLLLVVTAVGKDQSQIFVWTPRTVRPATYVHPRVSYEALRSELRLKLNLDNAVSLPQEPVNIVARYTHNDHINTGSRATLQLSQQHAAGELLMKLPVADAQIGLLRVDVDDWPNAFVYRIDQRNSQQTIPLAEEVQTIEAVEAGGRQVMATSDRFVAIEVDTVVSDGHFSPNQETVVVGLDLDRDRTLQNEASIMLANPVAASVFWHGCDAEGNMLLQSQVGKPIVTLPVSSNWNGQCAILANVQRDQTNLWSPSHKLTIDHEPPRILAAEVAGESEKLLGKPIEVYVRVDDGNLSGVSSVFGMWSLTGTSEIPDAASLVKGVKLQADTWSLTMPTTEMRSGSTLLLVRAQDQAGNVSDTCQAFIEVLDEAAVLRKKQTVTALVTGRVQFGTQPLAGIELTLMRKDAAAQKWSAKTNAAGEFAFKAIPSGSYQIEASGLVRGMRTTRTQYVEVAAPQTPLPILFRLDRPQSTPTDKL